MSKGINVYDRVRTAFGSVDESAALNKQAAVKEPCIFLSHKSEDKSAVKAVGEYIKDAGINIYLDADDAELQKAVHDGDDKKITTFLDRGIHCSTDVMVFISDKTKGSWWVHYEFGLGKGDGKMVLSLKLKDVTSLPSFLKIVPQLSSITELNSYLAEVNARTPAVEKIMSARGSYDDRYSILLKRAAILMEADDLKHPLTAYLNR